MKSERARGFAVVSLALAASACLFRPQISSALVMRGDDFMARGDAAGAMRRYERALWLDAGNGAALDRILFARVQSRGKGMLNAVMLLANAYLAKHPGDAAVLQDRALCEILLRRRADAAKDFEGAARASGDAQTFVFAGYAASAAGNTRHARRLWHLAILADPQSTAARAALGAVR